MLLTQQTTCRDVASAHLPSTRVPACSHCRPRAQPARAQPYSVVLASCQLIYVDASHVHPPIFVHIQNHAQPRSTRTSPLVSTPTTHPSRACTLGQSRSTHTLAGTLAASPILSYKLAHPPAPRSTAPTLACHPRAQLALALCSRLFTTQPLASIYVQQLHVHIFPFTRTFFPSSNRPHFHNPYTIPPAQNAEILV